MISVSEYFALLVIMRGKNLEHIIKRVNIIMKNKILGGCYGSII